MKLIDEISFIVRFMLTFIVISTASIITLILLFPNAYADNITWIVDMHDFIAFVGE